MEAYDAALYENNCFEAISIAVSEEGVELEESFTQAVEMRDFTELSAAELLSGIEAAFSRYTMNDHLATVSLLGDLGYSDMLMYYCIVSDCLNVYDKNSEKEPEIITPQQYISEKERIIEKPIELVFECSRRNIKLFNEVLSYLKNREFRILSNTFYMDGSDFLLFLTLKSTVGYNLRIKVVIKCDSENEAEEINQRLAELDFANGSEEGTCE